LDTEGNELRVSEQRAFDALNYGGLLLLVAIDRSRAHVSSGWALLAWGCAYAGAAFLLARRFSWPHWTSALAYSAGLGVLFILPDAYFQAVERTLTFPDHDFPSVLGVPLYMPGLWVAPFFVCILIASHVERTKSRGAALVTAAALGGIIVGSEVFAAPYWRPMNVATLGNVAYRIILPELFASLMCFYGYSLTRQATRLQKLLMMLATSFSFLGIAGFCYQLERLVRDGR
jgi:hypothetical protein